MPNTGGVRWISFNHQYEPSRSGIGMARKSCSERGRETHAGSRQSGSMCRSYIQSLSCIEPSHWSLALSSVRRRRGASGVGTERREGRWGLTRTGGVTHKSKVVVVAHSAIPCVSSACAKVDRGSRRRWRRRRGKEGGGGGDPRVRVAVLSLHLPRIAVPLACRSLLLGASV